MMARLTCSSLRMRGISLLVVAWKGSALKGSRGGGKTLGEADIVFYTHTHTHIFMPFYLYIKWLHKYVILAVEKRCHLMHNKKGPESCDFLLLI